MIISKVMLNSCNICAHKKGYRYRKWVRHYLPWFFSNICFQKTLYCLEQIFKLLLKFLLMLFPQVFTQQTKGQKILCSLRYILRFPIKLLDNYFLGNFKRCLEFMFFFYDLCISKNTQNFSPSSKEGTATSEFDGVFMVTY